MPTIIIETRGANVVTLGVIVLLPSRQEIVAVEEVREAGPMTIFMTMVDIAVSTRETNMQIKIMEVMTSDIVVAMEGGVIPGEGVAILNPFRMIVQMVIVLMECNMNG